MEALVVSSFKALRSLFAPGMLGVFVLCILLTVVVLMGFVGVASAFFSWLAVQLEGHYAIAPFVSWIGSIGSAVIAWFLFPGIMPIIISFFDEKIARLIESRDYPAAAPGHEPNFWRELLHDIRFTFIAILLNLLVLPLYLLPVVNLFLFYFLNGYLLGREFFVMVARRHMPVAEADALRKRYGRTVLVAGILLTVMATIPIANLFAPFWGIAVMVHLYHFLRTTPVSTVLPAQNH